MNIVQHKKAFGAVSKKYQQYRRSYDPRLYALLCTLVAKNREARILDVGCGTGKSTVPLLKVGKGVQVVGADHDPAMLREAKKAAKEYGLPIIYKKGAAERLPFLKGSFDAVTSGTAFHWFATKKALKEMLRVLVPKGLIFVYWTMERETDVPTIGLELYRKYKWKRTPHHLRNLDFIEDLFRKTGVAKVKTLTIPYVAKYTLEEYVGGLQTGSAYALMTPKERAGFTRDMKKAFREEVKGKFYRVDKEVRVCYGTKA
jgi:ubiquinone/menaquinone biosynthesis C-methylase UbiE